MNVLVNRIELIAIQLAKTGWVEKVIGILKGIGVHVAEVVIGLNRNSGQMHETVSDSCKLKLRRTITVRKTILICIAGLFAIALVLL